MCAGRRTGCWRRAWMWRPPSAGRTARSSCRAAVCFGRASSRSSRAAAGGPTAAFAGAGTGPRARLRPRRHRRHRRARRTRAAARPRPPFARRPAGPCASRCAALRAAPAQLPRLPSPPRRAAPLPARPLRPRGRLRRCRASAGCPPSWASRAAVRPRRARRQSPRARTAASRAPRFVCVMSRGVLRERTVARHAAPARPLAQREGILAGARGISGHAAKGAAQTAPPGCGRRSVVGAPEPCARNLSDARACVLARVHACVHASLPCGVRWP